MSTSFTITPSVTFTKTGSNFGFPEQAIAGTLAVTGFGSGEPVTIATPMWAATSFTCTTGTTPEDTLIANAANSGAGSCTVAVGTSIADITGGAKSIAATGAPSGLTATTTFTVNPWAAFYNSANSQTTYSFLGTAPTSLLVEVHGATAGTIAANSITIGGIATNHASYVVGGAGTVSGLGISPSSNVPFGNVAAVVQGNTFNYANGNIASGPVSTGQAISTVGVNRNIPWGGALISSIQGTSASTGIASLDASNYKPGTAFTASTSSPKPVQNQMGFFGYGFVPPSSTCGGTGGTLSISTPSGVTYSAGPTFFKGTGPAAGSPDCNGAFLATAGLGDTAWSTTATPTVAASYAPLVSQTTTAPANILSPNFGITAWDKIPASLVDYSTNTFNVVGHGFGPTDTLTVTVGGASMVTFGTCVVLSTGTCTTANGQVPDLGAGPQNVVLAGSVSGASVTTTSGTTYDPRINGGGSAATQTLNSVAGSAGSTTIIRTGTTFGVHGLYANTAYSIVWNGASSVPGVTGIVLGSFTSTATGGIPVPGVQFSIPADTSGFHIVDLQRTSTIGTSFMFGNNLQGDYNDVDPGLGTTSLSTNYGDMLFLEGTTLVATPTVAMVNGTTTISGSGLQANTLYDLGISLAGTDSSSPPVPTTCALTGTNPAAAPTTIVRQFTSTSTGTVPSGVTVAITDLPTFAGEEQGTLFCVFAQTASTFGTTTAAGNSQFLLEANANLNATSGPIGHNFIETAHGLSANKGYNILFAPYACGNSGAICGTVVGAILTNGQGAGSATFTVPSAIQTAIGSTPVNTGQSYSIQLEATGSTSVALAIPPTFTVSSGSTTTCNSTTCMTANGSPSSTTVGPNKAVQTSYTNNSNAPLTAIVYAVVHNAAGQTVSYSTATLQLNAGQSGTAYDVLFGLAPGTYTVSVFVTTTSGVAISSTSTVTVTV